MAIVWNYFTGYVIIDIKGRNLERFINRALQADINIWNVKRIGEHLIRANIDVKGFYSLKKIVSGSNIRIKIVEKHGAIMALSRFRNRKVLVWGWLFVLVSLILASRFVWFIDIDGCDKVKESEILELLNAQHINTGVLKKTISVYSLGQTIMQNDKRIAWAGAIIDGVRLKVSIKESEDIHKIESDKLPSSIYAKEDGIIKSIRIIDGKAKVNVGDAVIKGDELISGIIRDDTENKIVTHAQGNVIAQVERTVNYIAGPTVNKWVRSGNSKEFVKIRLFDKDICLSKTEYSHFEEEKIAESRFTGGIIPLVIEKWACFELADKNTRAEKQELEQIALQEAEKIIVKSIPKDAKIVSKKSETQVLTDGSVKVTVTFVTEENIGEDGNLNG